MIDTFNMLISFDNVDSVRGGGGKTAGGGKKCQGGWDEEVAVVRRSWGEKYDDGVFLFYKPKRESAECEVVSLSCIQLSREISARRLTSTSTPKSPAFSTPKAVSVPILFDDVRVRLEPAVCSCYRNSVLASQKYVREKKIRGVIHEEQNRPVTTSQQPRIVLESKKTAIEILFQYLLEYYLYYLVDFTQHDAIACATEYYGRKTCILIPTACIYPTLNTPQQLLAGSVLLIISVLLKKLIVSKRM